MTRRVILGTELVGRGNEGGEEAQVDQVGPKEKTAAPGHQAKDLSPGRSLVYGLGKGSQERE
jgi:hypothetical protein